MKRVIGLLSCWVIGFIVVFLSIYAFAQERPVELEGVIARIPAARILDWACGDCPGGIPTITTPTVNGNPGWQEQALSQGNVVRCPDDGNADTHNYVVVALNRPATNLAMLEEGASLTINEVEGSSADASALGSGEVLFDFGLLESGSTFTVTTPTATVGVSGTAFNVIVGANSTMVEALEGSVEVTDNTTDNSTPIYTDPDALEAGVTTTVDEGEVSEIIEDAANSPPTSVPTCEEICNDNWKTCKNNCPKGKEEKKCKKDCKEVKDSCRASCP